MADFTALKTAIQNAIKQNGNNEITGEILQGILLSMVNTLGDGAINDLVAALAAEVTNRQNAVGTEATTRGNADTALGGRIDGVITSINSINTKLAEGYIYGGIATPSMSMTAPSGKVFYFAVQAGTYTNFGNTVLTQGLNILKYNGSAWSGEQLVAFDNTPTENSTALVKSGGVFSAIKTVADKVADGYLYKGIATASTDPGTPSTKVFYIATAAETYTNFLDSNSAALVVTQGINILKYNGTSWSIEQVFGVDDEPTAGSDSLVKSGGVAKKIIELHNISRYKDAKICLIGDSISTYQGYVPEGFLYYYPHGAIDSVEKTYWWMVNNQLGSEIQNLSYSGSTVTNISHSLYSRVRMVDRDATLIIIALGRNDVPKEDNVGELDYTKPISSYNESVFTEAYLKGLRTLMLSNPNADFLLVTMCSHDDTPMPNRAAAIQSIAEHYGMMYFDARNSFSGEVHPDTLAEMQNIAKDMFLSLGEQYEQGCSKFRVAENISYDNSRSRFLSNNVSGVLNEISDNDSPNTKANNKNIDLDIADNYGNVLAEFANGHIRTKNFDSRNIQLQEDITEDADLDITDNNGNVLVKFIGGNIQTKYFNSNSYLKNTDVIYVAASDSTAKDKAMADYICDGTNDTDIIQAVINSCTKSANIIFMDGTYSLNPYKVDSEGNYGALIIPKVNRHLVLSSINPVPLCNGVNFVLTQSVYEGLGTTAEYSLIRGAVDSSPLGNDITVNGINFQIYDNLKKVICIDGQYLGHLSLYACRAIVTNQMVTSWESLPANFHIPNINCVAFRGLGKSQHAYSKWSKCSANSFGIGFACQGEHLMLENNGAVMCYYGHTFNYFESKVSQIYGAYAHGMILRNELEELCLNMPYFGENTFNQTLDITDFHIEWKPAFYSQSGNLATELVAGSWRGSITYQIQFGANRNLSNLVDEKFWADGNGIGMFSQNQAHTPACTTVIRNTYAPTYMQKVYDTTLNKEVICIDTANKTWVDVNGNNV